MGTGKARGAVGSGLLLLAAALVFLQPGPEDDLGGDVGREFAAGESVRAEVIRAVDGDTAEVLLRGRREYVRYIGVDTPESVTPGEPVECFGPRAAGFNAALIEDEAVRLVIGAEERDSYGRLLAYVHLGETFVNAELVSRGLARTLTIPPNDAHARLFRRLERRAGRAGRGLWGLCDP